jgi:hypothetical protein
MKWKDQLGKNSDNLKDLMVLFVLHEKSGNEL